jgi:hypothetical protein
MLVPNLAPEEDDPQLCFMLVQAPYGIRREIFTYLVGSLHLFQVEGILRFSVCTGATKLDEEHPGHDRLEGLPSADEYKGIRNKRYL